MKITNQNKKPFFDGKPLKPLPGACTEFLNDWDQKIANRCLLGGLGSGKSFSGVWKLLITHCWNAVGTDGTLTYIPSLICEPSWRLIDRVIVPYIQKLCKYFNIEYKYNKVAREFVLLPFSSGDMKSIIYLSSAEHAVSLQGASVGCMLADESATWRSSNDDSELDPYNQAMARVRGTGARFEFCYWVGTPFGTGSKFYKMSASRKKNVRTWHAHTVDNPAAASSYKNMLETLPAHMWDQYLCGVAMHFAGGSAFESFNQTKNVKEKINYDYSRPLQLSWDFGTKAGCFVLLGQYFENIDKITTVHEINRPNLEQTCLALHNYLTRLSAFNKFSEYEVFGDAAGNHDKTTSEAEYVIMQQYLESWGIKPSRIRDRVPLKNPPIIDRVFATNMALSDINGNPHWEISESGCKELLLDLRECRLDDKRKLDKSDHYRTHAIDAEGYRIFDLRPVQAPETNAQAGRFSFEADYNLFLKE